MLKYCTASLCLLVFGSTYGETTKKNFPVCVSSEDLGFLAAAVQEKDVATVEKLLNEKRCGLAKGGDKVKVVGSAFNGLAVQFVFSGVRLWTTREGLAK